MTCIIILMLLSCVVVYAKDTEGSVVSTDIAAFVNLQPIHSYNINGFTYIVAEDLRDYGFDVEWKGRERSLNITCNYKMAKPVMSVEEINVPKSSEIGKKLFDVYKTDIKTYIGGSLANAYNADGKTLIMLDELQKYGYFKWDSETRTVSVDIQAKRLESAFNDANDNKEIKISDTQTYIGQADGDIPNGIGKMITKSVQTEYPGTVTDITCLGFYEMGKKNGIMITHNSEVQTMGSGAPFSKSFIAYEEYVNDKLTGYSVKEYKNNVYFQKIGRTEGYYIDDVRDGFGRDWWKFNLNEYKYQYKIVEQGKYINGSIVDRYEAVEYSDMPYIYVSPQIAIKEDGTLWFWGDPGYRFFIGNLTFTDPKKDKPFYIAEGIKEAVFVDLLESTYRVSVSQTDAYGFKGIFAIKTDGTLVAYNLAGEQLAEIAKDVVSVSPYYFVNSKNEMYSIEMMVNKNVAIGQYPGNYSFITKPIGYNIKTVENDYFYDSFITVDNELYIWGANHLFQIGEQYPETVLSPVLISRDVKLASISNEFAFIKNDNSLWIWGFLEHLGLDGKEVTDAYTSSLGFTYVKKPQHVMDDVKQVVCGNGHVTALKNDGSVWTWGNGKNGEIGNGKNDDSMVPVMIMEDVKLISDCYALKNDGTLWAWGDNRENNRALGESVASSNVPVQITGNYKPIVINY